MNSPPLPAWYTLMGCVRHCYPADPPDFGLGINAMLAAPPFRLKVGAMLITINGTPPDRMEHRAARAYVRIAGVVEHGISLGALFTAWAWPGHIPGGADCPGGANYPGGAVAAAEARRRAGAATADETLSRSPEMAGSAYQRHLAAGEQYCGHTDIYVYSARARYGGGRLIPPRGARWSMSLADDPGCPEMFAAVPRLGVQASNLSLVPPGPLDLTVRGAAKVIKAGSLHPGTTVRALGHLRFEAEGVGSLPPLTARKVDVRGVDGDTVDLSRVTAPDVDLTHACGPGVLKCVVTGARAPFGRQRIRLPPGVVEVRGAHGPLLEIHGYGPGVAISSGVPLAGLYDAAGAPVPPANGLYLLSEAEDLAPTEVLAEGRHASLERLDLTLVSEYEGPELCTAYFPRLREVIFGAGFTRLPALSRMPSLRLVDITRCTGLVAIPPGFLDHSKGADAALAPVYPALVTIGPGAFSHSGIRALALNAPKLAAVGEMAKGCADLRRATITCDAGAVDSMGPCLGRCGSLEAAAVVVSPSISVPLRLLSAADTRQRRRLLDESSAAAALE
jgi:hypothetical protein